MRLACGPAIAGLFVCACAAANPPDLKERTEWIKSHAAPVRSVDIADDDFSDLMPMAKAIGESRIVQLGEATHGDGTTFLAKARIVRFLHEVMGFDVMVWESGLLGCRLMDAAMRDPEKSPHDAAKDHIYGVWSESTQVQGLLDYIKQTQRSPRPIISAGVDCRLGYDEQKARIVPQYLIGFFDRIDPQLLTQKQREEIVRICKTVEYGDYYKHPGVRDLDISVMKNLVKYLDDNGEKAAKSWSGEEIGFIRQLLLSEIGYEQWCNEVGRKIEPTSTTRDVIMGRTLIWQATRNYPDRKLIVWAHNFHVMEWDSRMSEQEAASAAAQTADRGPMGQTASLTLGRQIYSIGFLGGSGSYAYANADEKPTPIPPATEGTLDWYLSQVQSPFSFLDFQGLPADHWLRQPVVARFYFWEPSPSIWPRKYDAVFFSRKMEPSAAIAH